MLETLIIAVLLFCLLWYLISILPVPESIAKFKWVFYAILVVASIIYLLKLI